MGLSRCNHSAAQFITALHYAVIVQLWIIVCAKAFLYITQKELEIKAEALTFKKLLDDLIAECQAMLNKA